MADRWLKRKFAELDTAPLFGEPAGRTTTKRKPIKNVARAKCPDCGKTVGLYVISSRDYRRVLGYRRHYRRTHFGNHTFPCPGSNVEAPEPEGISL